MDATERSKRVVFVIAHLGPGGAQRVAATAANALVARGVDVRLFTLLAAPPDSYTLDPRVQRHILKVASREEPDINGGDDLVDAASAQASAVPRGDARPPRAAHAGRWRKIWRRARLSLGLLQQVARLRQNIERIAPDAVLSFLTQTNIMTLLATRGLNVWTVVSERNDPRRQLPNKPVVLMRRLLYRHSDVVTANSRGALNALEDIVPKSKLAFLPNPLDIAGSPRDVAFAQPTMISVTRLVEQKGVDVLLKAAARAFDTVPEWRLAIVGDGPLSGRFKAMVRDLGIGDRVDWRGHVADPIPYLRAAKLFILTSRFEGSPNALLEAMACGLPSIVSDASPGPLELIGEEEAGLIVPVEDVEATAAAIVRLAQDEHLRTRLGAAALERTRPHEIGRAMQVWLKLLNCA
jgi:glycosyltransferase involved in cell wall biosynthesis